MRKRLLTPWLIGLCLCPALGCTGQNPDYQTPLDLAGVRAALGPDFLTVVPGIRPAETAANDQKRIATPASAIAAGADILVIGRAITGAADPAAAARAILASLA